MINRGVRVGEMAPSKSTSFPDMLEMAHIFFMPCMTNSRHHAKLFWFSTSFAFFVVFSVKKMLDNGRPCHNLHTLSEIVQTWHG